MTLWNGLGIEDKSCVTTLPWWRYLESNIRESDLVASPQAPQ